VRHAPVRGPLSLLLPSPTPSLLALPVEGDCARARERPNPWTHGDGADQDWDAIAASMAASDLSSGRTAKDCWLP
jgi:hypothetical protein